MRIVVVGGGYAGLACLARLARVLPDAERHLLDPGRWHLLLRGIDSFAAL